MPEQRMIFKKEGIAKYISHLDLLRTLRRSFVRAGIELRYSEGFNPHPKMSVALPLPVGQESVCEILDFALCGGAELSEIPGRLNEVLPSGICMTEAYDAQRRIKELRRVAVCGEMTYDGGVPGAAEEKLAEFFAQSSIVISKRSKSGVSDFDIVPCVHGISFAVSGENTVTLNAVISAQDPALNPENLIASLRQLKPELAPDFASFRRTEIYDTAGAVFR